MPTYTVVAWGLKTSAQLTLGLVLVKKRFNCQRKFLPSKNDDDDDNIGAALMVVLVSICRCPLSHASQLHRFVHCDLFLAIPSTSLHIFYVKTFGSIFC